MSRVELIPESMRSETCLCECGSVPKVTDAQYYPPDGPPVVELWELRCQCGAKTVRVMELGK